MFIFKLDKVQSEALIFNLNLITHTLWGGPVLPNNNKSLIFLRYIIENMLNISSLQKPCEVICLLFFMNTCHTACPWLASAHNLAFMFALRSNMS